MKTLLSLTVAGLILSARAAAGADSDARFAAMAGQADALSAKPRELKHQAAAAVSRVKDGGWDETLKLQQGRFGLYCADVKSRYLDAIRDRERYAQDHSDERVERVLRYTAFSLSKEFRDHFPEGDAGEAALAALDPGHIPECAELSAQAAGQVIRLTYLPSRDFEPTRKIEIKVIW